MTSSIFFNVTPCGPIHVTEKLVGVTYAFGWTIEERLDEYGNPYTLVRPPTPPDSHALAGD